MFQEIDVPEIADFLLISLNGQCKVIENEREKKNQIIYCRVNIHICIKICGDDTIAHFGFLQFHYKNVIFARITIGSLSAIMSELL